jgi:GTP cyclohydrolase II
MEKCVGFKPFSLQRALHTSKPLCPKFSQPPPFDYTGRKDICCMDPFGLVSATPSIAWCYAALDIPELRDIGTINCMKIAIEPVWELAGVAHRLQMPVECLRQLIYKGTSGAFPNILLEEVSHFLPPIGATTVYVFGDLARKNHGITVRIQDSCNSSDVFGATICTCRQSLMYGIRQAVEQSERGGVGIVMYCNNEGRALGEVTKFRVYHERAKGKDTPEAYFQATVEVAGVEDARTPILQMDPLLWLGIHEIDTLVGDSKEKLGALKALGITVKESVSVPDRVLPINARTEIEAKQRRNNIR